MNVPETEYALGSIRFDPELLGSMIRVGKSIEVLKGRIVHCEGCGCVVLDREDGALHSLAAALVELIARLQGRHRKAAGKRERPCRRLRRLNAAGKGGRR